MTTRSAETITSRERTIGEALRDGRIQKGKSVEESAQAVSILQATLDAYERGDDAPSLPELESLAYYYDLPIEYFTENALHVAPSQNPVFPNFIQYIKIRQRIIGVTLHQARVESELTIEMLAEKTGINASQIEQFELGRVAVPLPQLIHLCKLVNRDLRDFQDHVGPIGKSASQQKAVQEFLSLPIDLQLFVSKPVNRPYLDLAVRLSEMSVDRLRAVAEGLLEITY